MVEVCAGKEANMRRSILVFVFVLAFGGAAYAAFEITTIETGNTGVSTATAVGPADIPDICYYDAANKMLKVAELTQGAWHIYPVDSDGDVGMNCSLYVDSGDDPHVAYMDNANWDLRYAYRSGGLWSTQTLVSDKPVGLAICMREGPAGWPRITYEEDESGVLTYLWFDGSGQWYTYVVDQLHGRTQKRPDGHVAGSQLHRLFRRRPRRPAPGRRQQYAVDQLGRGRRGRVEQPGLGFDGGGG
jgi:hypothetical protein